MRILIADDHRMMRDGLRAILERAGLEVVGEADGGRLAVEEALRLRPDVVLMDVSMPDLNGVGATERIAAEVPEARVVALSMNADRRYVEAMFKAGAVGYLLKNAASDELLVALRAVADGLTYVSPAIASHLVDRLRDPAGEEAPPLRALSGREREVLQLVAEGGSSKEIATRLALSVSTVESHRRQIMDKLQLRTIAELTKYAIREGLTPIE